MYLNSDIYSIIGDFCDFRHRVSLSLTNSVILKKCNIKNKLQPILHEISCNSDKCLGNCILENERIRCTNKPYGDSGYCVLCWNIINLTMNSKYYLRYCKSSLY